MLKKTFDGFISYMQILDENGNVDKDLFPKDLDDKTILDMYKYMNLARAVDAKALSLQRQGRLATYAPLVGQEAEQIGSAMAMDKKDLLVPNYRQHGVMIVRGLQLKDFFVFWKGYEDGAATFKSINSLAVAVPVGTQTQHATGLAYAQKYLNTNSSVVTYIGDGGTSEGDFYEAMNFAGVMKVPLLIIIENNQWAISVPRAKQSAAQTLAQKAMAAGIEGMQVDGNDVFAVYKATKEALAKAQKSGPVLLECITYRMSMHTTSDDPTKYRSEEEVDSWKAKDPIERLKNYIIKKGIWNDSNETNMKNEQQMLIDEAVKEAEQFKPNPKDMFETVYSFMPETLKEEYDDAITSNFWIDKN
ncbi:MAG: pyruvate dehydrogenase (acetyl-transferring) E1 component subunit alpha [Candidatus Micrarchaeia archaeon]